MVKYHWWHYIKWVIRDQPKKIEELSAMRSAAPSADGMPRGRSVSRTTENLAMREFTGIKRREYEAVRKAAAETEPERLALINLVYWRQSHTLRGAAEQIPISYETAVNWNRAFIKRVAAYMGLLDE